MWDLSRTALILLNFESPYHVGWRSAEPIIEGFTVHRALIYASVVVEGDASRTGELTELRVSAALPALSAGNCYRLLLPTPPLPSRVALKKRTLRWTTIKAVASLARGMPYILNIVEEGGEEGRIAVCSEEGLLELCYKNEVIHECEKSVEAPIHILERVDVHVNKVDRITNTADVYKVIAYKPYTKLGVALQGEDSTINYVAELFKVVEELGIGGMRSRGYGRFTTEIGTLCDEDEKLLVEQRGPGRLVLLGSYTFNDSIDRSKSIVNKRNVAGYAGPAYDNYVLPYLDYIGSGSIVHATTNLSPIRISVKTSRAGALIVFNPVVAGATA